MVGYTFGNIVYSDASPIENFEYGYPHSNALLILMHFCLISYLSVTSRIKRLVACLLTKCDVQ